MLYSGSGPLQEPLPMPVTAKLSRRFYDKFGDEIANELVEWFNAVDATYRADLRELNELNFQRFDAKLEQRIAELRSEIEQRIAELRIEFLGELGKIRGELEKTKSWLLRWMFGFWIGTLAPLAGLIILLSR
jgi:hypothetical protein